MATKAMRPRRQGRDRGPDRAITWRIGDPALSLIGVSIFGKMAIFAAQQISPLYVYWCEFSNLTVKLLINSSTVSMQF